MSAFWLSLAGNANIPVDVKSVAVFFLINHIAFVFFLDPVNLHVSNLDFIKINWDN